jgi:hypothetical protein
MAAILVTCFRCMGTGVRAGAGCDRCTGSGQVGRPLIWSDVVVETRDYQSNHGNLPRGRGCWLFCTVDPRRVDYLDHLIRTASGPYAAAKRQARIEAAAKGVQVLYVCS